MKRNDYSLGLASVSFRKHSPEQILQAMREAGLTHVEWGSDVHAPCGELPRLRELVCLQKQYGITCSSYGTYFCLGKTPMDELPLYFQAAKILGTNVVRVWCGDKDGAQMNCEEREELFAQCRQAEALAREHGIVLCLECHIRTFTQRLPDALALMQTMDSEYFRMYWQPFGWLSPRENQQIAQALAPYTRHLHVFYWRGDTRLFLREGIDQWQGYLQAFSGPRTLLLEFVPENRIEYLGEEARALRSIAGV